MCYSKFDSRTVGQEFVLYLFKLFEFIEIEYNINFLYGQSQGSYVLPYFTFLRKPINIMW